MEAYFSIGNLLSAHGLKGELLLSHRLKDTAAFRRLKVIFIEDDHGSFLPYFLQSCNPGKAGVLLLGLEGIRNREPALALVGKAVYLRREDYFLLSDIHSPHTWLGFEIIELHLGSLGQITEIMETRAQVLATLSYKGNTVLIPLNPGNILGLDRENHRITVDLPEGLPGLPI